VSLKDKTAVILDVSTAYAEMGGQMGDSALLEAGADYWSVSNTTKSGPVWLHFIDGDHAPAVGQNFLSSLIKTDVARLSATIPSRISCTGRCTKLFPRTPLKRALS
jgi:alanyl-tRNA synthetase